MPIDGVPSNEMTRLIITDRGIIELPSINQMETTMDQKPPAPPVHKTPDPKAPKVFGLGEGSEVDAPDVAQNSNALARENRVTANAATQAEPDQQWPASGPWDNPFSPEGIAKAQKKSPPPAPAQPKSVFPPQQPKK